MKQNAWGESNPDMQTHRKEESGHHGDRLERFNKDPAVLVLLSIYTVNESDLCRNQQEKRIINRWYI